MFRWLRAIFKKKNRNNINPCSTCVWWAAEEENNVERPKNGLNRYCDVYKDYTKPSHTCALWKEERFDATPESIQTEELEINHELAIEESEFNDQGSRQK